MKVLVWSPHVNPGGGSRLLYRLVAGMCRHPRINIVRLAVPDSATFPDWFAAETEGRLERFSVGEPAHGFGRYLGIPGSGRFVRAAAAWFGADLSVAGQLQRACQVAASDCDIAYSNWPHDHAGFGFRPCGGVPWIASLLDLLVLDYPWNYEMFSREHGNVCSWLSRAARIVVPSEATAHAIRRHFPDWNGRPTVIHHAISPAAIRPVPRRLTRPDRAPMMPYVVCPTNLAQHKNLDRLLTAWARMPDRASLPLLIFGNHTDTLKHDCLLSDVFRHGHRPLELGALLKRNGLLHGRDFHALGYVPDAEVEGLVSNAEALIMPSLGEGGGSFPVEEALDAGVPVLCSDIPVMREHLSMRTARVGWFDPESVGDIVRCVAEFRSRTDEYKASAMAGSGDPRPTWDDVAARYVDVFAETLSHPTRFA